MRDHAANRFMVTSRPYGYIRLAGEIAHFQLPNFSSQQVDSFVLQWQRAFERWQRPDAPDLAAADKEASETLGEIRLDPKVAELATNPLMLVIITIIRHEQARLPQERVRLYDCAVNTLMETWNYWRAKVAGLDTNSRQLPVGQLIEVWAAAAEWTRRTIPTGVIHRGQLKRKLVEVLTEKELDEGHPEATAEAYLEAAANRAGLLEERGPDVFAFWHPTFEEFLAAVALTTPTSKAVESLLPLRDDPRWREVILLAVGYVGIVQRDRDTATAIVQAIADHRHGPIEPILHPHLRLAAECVADNAGIKPAATQQIVASPALPR
jgi:predicted NACHT family NTPase